MPEQIVRDDPRISLNKLGDYLTAPARRRRRIVEEQKRPSTFRVTYYDDARSALAEFYRGGATDDQVIIDAINALEQSSPESDFQKQMRNSCIEVLDLFLEVEEDVDLSDLRSDVTAYESGSMHLNGVEVSVRPEVVFRTEGGDVVGGLKIHFSKTHPLDKRAAGYVATILHQYLEQEFECSISPTDCHVMDIYAQEVIAAPRHYKRRRQDIAAACEEIRTRWPTV